MQDAIQNPLKALVVSLRGVRTEGEMKPDVSLDQQRPAEYVFSQHVQHKLDEIRLQKPERKLTPAE